MELKKVWFKDLTLFEALIKSGVSEEEMSSHYSDLYVPANDKTDSIIKRWSKATGNKVMLTVFTDNITGNLMYDIPFANDRYWQEKLGRKAD